MSIDSDPLARSRWRAATASAWHGTVQSLILAAVLALVHVGGLTAAASTQLIVSPADQYAVVNDIAYVDILVVDAVQLFSAEFTLHYDPQIVGVNSVDVGPLFEGATPILRLDEETGTVLFAVSLDDSAAPVTGSGPMAVLELQGQAEGSTVLLLDGTLSDPAGDYLPVRVRGGTFSVTAQPIPGAEQPTVTTEPVSAPPSPQSPPPATAPVPSASVPSPADTTATPAPGESSTAVPNETAVPTDRSSPPADSVPPQSPQEGAASASSPTMPATGTAIAQSGPPTTTISAPSEPTAGPERAPGVPTVADPGTGPLSPWLFLLLLALLLCGVGALAVVVSLSIWTWYRGARG